MDFASDNTRGACAQVMASLCRHNPGAVPAYGDDALTARVKAGLCDMFGRKAEIFFMTSGTAANALGLAASAPPGAIVYCHRHAHINVDECHAPEFMSGGAKLVGLDGENGKIEPEALREALQHGHTGSPHGGQPFALSVTQPNEFGAVYTPQELHALSEICRKAQLVMHMDGARFANAVAALGCAPADISWRTGVDVLSFGATKNGCWAAEAVLFFRSGLAGHFAFRCKRAGHLLSKYRFVSAQFSGWLEEGTCWQLAAHANDMAHQLASCFDASCQIRLALPQQVNIVMAEMTPQKAQSLHDAGATFYPWPFSPQGAAERLSHGACEGAPKGGEGKGGNAPQTGLYRFVTSFDTRSSEIEQLSALLQGAHHRDAPGKAYRTLPV